MSNLSYESNKMDNELGTTKKGSYLLGAVGAVLGAFIGSIPWAIVYYFGWFVGWLGFIIGICAVKGYEILRGKTGKVKVLIIILATIFGVACGQVIGDFIALGRMIATGEIPGATYMDIPSIYRYLIVENSIGFITDSLKNLVIGLLFAGLGIWRMIKSMWSKS